MQYEQSPRHLRNINKQFEMNSGDLVHEMGHIYILGSFMRQRCNVYFSLTRGCVVEVLKVASFILFYGKDREAAVAAGAV